MFQISINDPKFRNHDNEYIEFKLHQYTNIDTDDISKPPLKKFSDNLIPLVDCDKKYNEDSVWTEKRIVNYCPKFEDKHLMIGGYYDYYQAWYRLGVHRCDPTKRKKCASKEEQDKYIRNQLIYTMF